MNFLLNFECLKVGVDLQMRIFDIASNGARVLIFGWEIRGGLLSEAHLHQRFYGTSRVCELWVTLELEWPTFPPVYHINFTLATFLRSLKVLQAAACNNFTHPPPQP